MSFRRAKEHLEQALTIAQERGDKAIEKSLIEGLLEMNRSIERECDDMKTRLKAVEQLVRRLN